MQRGRLSQCGLQGIVLLAAALAGALPLEGATPRWTTGPPYFTVVNTPVIWYLDQPLYFTDSGNLSASVNHAAADAMVAAAASVWNVPTARMVLAQGGALAEDVNGTNVYPDSNGLVFPADVDSSNYAAKQIAVIYDQDGSVTDLLMGSGASDPSGCRQNAVTESVDAVTTDGFIQHAVLILNGRCTGPDPQMQQQMQYQLEREFGRVLGLGWSQLNDNVFTGSPQPTFAQAQHWPIMHPIDVLCGLYSYQCLPSPFTLRDDDIASISTLYPVLAGAVPAGKQVTRAQASTQDGALYFPAIGGMAGVNIVIRRNPVPLQVVDGYDDVSAVSGVFMQQTGATPIAAKPTDMMGSLGSLTLFYEKDFGFTHDTAGYFYFGYIPLPSGSPLMDELFRSEAINPLYIGTYAVGPYPLSTVAPSGSNMSWRTNGVAAGYYGWAYPQALDGAASTCMTTGDGTEESPADAAPGGWWTDVSCGQNPSPLVESHTSWTKLPVQANRSLAIEVTALDESGLASVNKVRPVMGVWSAADATGTAPSVGVAGTAFNSIVLGMTALPVQTAGADTLRFSVSNERGDGRPDYGYQTRVLYADAIAPVTGTVGTQITISGMGFRAGNTVRINGIAAIVSSWTATTIVATVPFISSVLPATAVTFDVSVSDLSTHGTTVMGAAFQYVYSVPTYSMQLVSAPAGNVPVSLAATPALSVRLIGPDGISPAVGAAVLFSATAGGVTWSACGAPTCSVLTDAHGLATVTVTPNTLGTITVQAAAFGVSQTATFNAVALVRSGSIAPSVEYLAAGATVSWTEVATFLQQGSPGVGAPVAWSAGAGPLRFSGAHTVTDAAGAASATVTVGPLAADAQATGTACAWANICASLLVQGVGPADFVVVLAAGAGQTVPATQNLAPISIEIVDGAGDPIAGAAVQVHQTVSQWTAPCPAVGRCPVAPVYGTSNATSTSDSNGMVSLVPLEIAGPEVTDLVVTSGTQGFVSLTLQKHP
jgi:hypothetical protein